MQQLPTDTHIEREEKLKITANYLIKVKIGIGYKYSNKLKQIYT